MTNVEGLTQWVLRGAVALAIAAGGTSSLDAFADDFGGTTTPKPQVPDNPDDPCKSMCCDKPSVADPVMLISGAERLVATDLLIHSFFPIIVTRHYDSRSDFDTALGFGWSFLFDRRLFQYPDGSILIRTGCGVRARFTQTGGTFVTPRDSTQGTLTQNPDGTYEFRYTNGARDIYDADGRLSVEESRDGQRHEFIYDSRGKLPLSGTSPYSVDPTQPMVVAYMPRLTHIQEKSADGQLTGFTLDFTYDENTGRLTKIATNDGREVNYTHDVVNGGLTKGNLTQVDGLGGFYSYKYEDANDAHNVTWIQQGQNGTPAQNTYDTQGRITQQTEGTTVTTFVYQVPRGQTNVSRKIFNDQGALLYTSASRYYFDEAGYLTSIVNGASAELKSFYNANKDLEHEEWRNSFNGTTQKTVYYTYDGQGHKLSERVTLDAADGGETVTRSWEYDQGWVTSEQVVSDADPAKIFRAEYTYVRDANNKPVALESLRRRNDDGSFATTTFSYCAAADVAAPNSTCPYLYLIKSEDGPRADVNDTTTYTYYPATDQSGCSSPPAGSCHQKGKLWKVTNALGQVTEYARYDQAGRITRVLDENGVATDVEYDARGHVLARKVRGADDLSETDDAITRYVYDDSDHLSRVTWPNSAYLDFTYDGRHRLTVISDNAGDSVHYTLDSEGNRLREDVFDPDDTLKRTMTRSFTAINQTLGLKNALGSGTTYGYDARGNISSLTDALTRLTTLQYDDLERLTKSVQDAGTGGLAATTKYTYDAANNLRKIIDPKNLTTEYRYDAHGNLLTVISPDTGTTSYTYDAADNRSSQTDARLVQTTFTYDALNRLTAIHYPTSTLDEAFFYDEADAVTGCSGSFPVGRLTRMTDVSGSTTYCYDGRGNVTQKQQIVATTTLTVKYAYDLANNLTSVEYPGATSAVYQRDSLGRISSLTYGATGGSHDPILNSIAYLPFGAPTTFGFANAEALTKTYDHNYWVTDVEGGSLNLHFRRDALGNISALGAAPGVPTVTEQYTYDSLYRLKGVLDPSNANIESFTYDGVGNRLTQTIGSGSPQSYVYGATSHRLQSVAGQARSYFDNGDTHTDAAGGRTYVYDDRNRLVSYADGVGNAVYQYNARGERVSKTVGATTIFFLYDERGELLGEYDSAGAAKNLVVYADRIAVAAIINGAIHYIYSDQVGTPRAISDASGTTVWTWAFASNPFGESAATPAAFFNLRFPGQYFDAESGLHYNFYRDYEPKTGRFIESDPMGLRGGASSYAYVSSSPLKYIDLLGLFDSCLDNWDEDYYEARTGNTRNYSHLLFSFTIFGPPTPAIPDLHYPPVKDPRNMRPIDFIGWYIDMWLVSVMQVEEMRQFELWQKGTHYCYHYDDCGRPLGWTPTPTAREVGPFWRTEDTHLDTTTQYIGRLDIIEFPFGDENPPPPAYAR